MRSKYLLIYWLLKANDESALKLRLLSDSSYFDLSPPLARVCQKVNLCNSHIIIVLHSYVIFLFEILNLSLLFRLLVAYHHSYFSRVS